MPHVPPNDDWLLRLQTVGVVPQFPRVWTVAVETRAAPSYHLCGRTRRDLNHCVFQYTLAGTGVFENAAGTWDIGVEQGFLCEVRDPAVVYRYPARARRPWRFLFCGFDGEAACLMMRAMVARHGPVYRLPVGAPIIRRLLGMGDLIASDGGGPFDGAGCEMASTVSRRIGRRHIAQSESLALVDQLLAALLHAREAESAGDTASLLVRRAMELIDQRVADDFNVSQLAAGLKVSREHLTRVFQAHTGRTPHDYLVRQKMLAACTLAKDTDCSIKEIAGRVGYNSAAHFTRVFRGAFGMTPLQFRASGHIPAL